MFTTNLQGAVLIIREGIQRERYWRVCSRSSYSIPIVSMFHCALLYIVIRLISVPVADIKEVRSDWLFSGLDSPVMSASIIALGIQ